MTEESQMEKWINEFNAAHPAKSPPPRVGGVQVQILRAGPYSDFNVPGRPGKVGAQHLNEGEMAEFPRPYAESLVAAGLAVEVMPESEPELEPQPMPEAQAEPGLAPDEVGIPEYVPDSDDGLEELDQAIANDLATPAARALAEEHGVPLWKIEGKGQNGRILVSDVRAILEDGE